MRVREGFPHLSWLIERRTRNRVQFHVAENLGRDDKEESWGFPSGVPWTDAGQVGLHPDLKREGHPSIRSLLPQRGTAGCRITVTSCKFRFLSRGSLYTSVARNTEM